MQAFKHLTAEQVARLFGVRDNTIVFRSTGSSSPDYRGALFHLYHLAEGIWGDYLDRLPVQDAFPALLMRDGEEVKPTPVFDELFQLNDVPTRSDKGVSPEIFIKKYFHGNPLDMLADLAIQEGQGALLPEPYRRPLTEIVDKAIQKAIDGTLNNIDLLGCITPRSAFDTLAMLANLLPKNKGAKPYTLRIWDKDHSALVLAEAVMPQAFIDKMFPRHQFSLEYHVEDLTKQDLYAVGNMPRSDFMIADVLSYYLADESFFAVIRFMHGLAASRPMSLIRSLNEPNGPPPSLERQLNKAEGSYQLVVPILRSYFSELDTQSDSFRAQWESEVLNPFKQANPPFGSRGIFMERLFMALPLVTGKHHFIYTSTQGGTHPRYFVTHFVSQKGLDTSEFQSQAL